jgi:hypothetical protein
MVTVKYSITSVTLALIIILFPGAMLPAMISPVLAATATSTAQMHSIYLPSHLSDTQISTAIQIATSDAGIKSIINGRLYEIMSHDQIGNFYNPNLPWKPEIHFNVNNASEVTAVIDLQTRKVESASEMPLKKLLPAQHDNYGYRQLSDPPGYALDYYSGSHTLNGIEMAATAPSYNTADGNPNTTTAFLVNALESGGSDANACTSSDWKTSYFGQLGFAWVGSVEAAVWTDTTVNCAIQNTQIGYTAGHNYAFEIYTVSGVWNELGWDVTTGVGFFNDQTGVNNLTFKTNDINTSVWFENQNSQSSTAWVKKYSSTLLSATAQYSPDNTNNWYNWDSDHSIDLFCTHNTSTPSQAISGTLASGNAAEWKLDTISTVDYAC